MRKLLVWHWFIGQPLMRDLRKNFDGATFGLWNDFLGSMLRHSPQSHAWWATSLKIVVYKTGGPTLNSKLSDLFVIG